MCIALSDDIIAFIFSSWHFSCCASTPNALAMSSDPAAPFSNVGMSKEGEGRRLMSASSGFRLGVSSGDGSPASAALKSDEYLQARHRKIVNMLVTLALVSTHTLFSY